MPTEPLKASAPRWKRLARQLLPARVQEHLLELRELSGAERRAHVATTLRRLLIGRGATIPLSLGPSDVVVFVCHGNIIRSALAEALMRRHGTAAGVSFDRIVSAGLAARPGREADPRAVAAARALGVDLAAHRAQPFTAELAERASVIFVMDRLNEARLLARFPQASAKLRRLGALAATEEGDVIADPYVLDAAAVAAVASRIDRATNAIVREIARRARANAVGTP
jgi:protein-tyrosine-phosphatase